MKNIALVLGTAREGRMSERVALYLRKHIEAQKDVTLQYVDVRDHVHTPHTTPPWGAGGAEKVHTEWQRIAEDADIFICILPEYNHGYPGEWKLLVDSLYDEYKGKHAYIVGVSNGIFSGVRVADHVKPVLVELGFLPHKTALYVGHVDTTFDEAGNALDEKFTERANTFVEKVLQCI